MTGNDEDHDRSRRLGAEDGEWLHMSGTRWSEIERSGDAVCGLYRAQETRSASFLVQPQIQGRRFVSCLTSESLRQFFNGLTLKLL
jgi:hypothetical protein